MMLIQPPEQPQPDEPDALSAALIDSLARQVKRDARQAIQGRGRRFQQVAAEFAHLGSVAEELLGHALQDLERTPDYFAALTRLGLSKADEVEKPAEQANVVEGTATKPEVVEEANDEQQEQQ